MAEKTIARTYKKKSLIEHILNRPDTYIGSVEPVTDLMWVYDKKKQHMVQRELKYVPGLYKIFDEILVNAADNKQRDPKMDTIKIDIDSENNIISVWNNGQGIPVAMHDEENMYVPTLIFGHLLTSSNYDDEEEKVTGGRNGYGAKLCNIFSHRFTVETSSKIYKKSFKQTWGKNMSKASEPRIKEGSNEDFTKVTFSPDLEKFNMEKLDDDIVSLITKRVYDVAASCKGVKVKLNGTLIPVKNFKDYVELFVKGREDEAGNHLKIAYEICGARWEVAVTMSDGGFQQISFVNSIATTKGGRHVDHVTEVIVKNLTETLNKKNKAGMSIKPFQVKNHLWIFINCLINNPSFDSQTKEHMTSQAKSFGSKCQITDKFFGQILKTGIVEAVMSWAKFKADSQLQKLGPKSKQRRLQGMPKLEDANDAGTAKSMDCTLILTEGDSAKASAVAGLSIIGRDKFGVFPLRGKLLNVREATHKQILENAEINNIIKIIGLQYKKKYETKDDLKTLRYGKIMIMTDQDADGSHIKGLLINFIHHNWPGLLKLNFLEEFITPIVKATKGRIVENFYSLPEFEEWKAFTENWHTFTIKYYKGLGTSTSKESKEYFSDMNRHRIRFRYEGEQDDQNIVMAFSKKMADERKDWLTNHMEETKERKTRGLKERFLYQKDTSSVSYSDFVNVELVLFSNYDNVRSIPSMIDGLKPGQRKVMFTCFKRNDKKEVKVAQLAGSVSEKSGYHHGEASLMTTIVNLAQNYVGSNNINLLQPIGQFGTRLQGGKDAASPRYIYTLMSPLIRAIFHKNDEPLLTYEREDNKKVEPIYYVPVIPMVLVNGADGIGTGWMTKIPNYNPREIIDNLFRMMKGDEMKPMKPFYKNFEGTIEAYGDHRYIIYGEIYRFKEDQIEIRELPIGVWTQNYKESVLEPMLSGTDKSSALITDYKEYNTDTKVKIIVTLNPSKLDELEKEGLHKVFKIQTTMSLTSMCAFDDNSCLKKYDNVAEIMKKFYEVRVKYYEKRKNYLEGILDAESSRLSNQARFIVAKCNGTLTIENKKKKDMIQELIKEDYHSDPVAAWKFSQDRQTALEDAAEAVEDEEPPPEAVIEKENFDYLLSMTMWNLTKEKKDELLKQRDDKIGELHRLRAKTVYDLWTDDLNDLLLQLNKLEKKEKEEEDISAKSSKKPVGKMFNSGNLQRIVPLMDVEMKKRIDKLDIVSKEKKDGTKKPLRFKKVLETIEEEKDEFDNLVESNAKSLENRIGMSPEKKTKKKTEGGRQTTLPFKPIDKKKKGKISKVSDSEETDDPGTNFKSMSSPLPQQSITRLPRKTAAAKKKYNFDSDSENFESELLSVIEDAPIKPSNSLPTSAVDMSDSEEEFKFRKLAASKLNSEESLKKNDSVKTISKKSTTTKNKKVTNQNGNKNRGVKRKQPIAPAMDVEMKKKMVKLDIISKEKKDGTKKPLRVKKVLGIIEEEKDEFDNLVESNAKSLENRIGMSPEKKTKKKTGVGRQTTIKKATLAQGNKKAANAKTGVKRKAKKVQSSDEDSDFMLSKKAKRSDSNDESSFVDESPVIRKIVSRAKKQISYAIDSDDSD